MSKNGGTVSGVFAYELNHLQFFSALMALCPKSTFQVNELKQPKLSPKLTAWAEGRSTLTDGIGGCEGEGWCSKAVEDSLREGGVNAVQGN